MSWGSVNVASDAWAVRLPRGGRGGRCKRSPEAPPVARNFQFHSSSRISEKFVEVLVLYTTLGASAVSRLDTSRLQQTKLLHKRANAYCGIEKIIKGNL